MAQDVTYSLWERAEGPWLCLATALLFSPCFPLFPHCSLLRLNLFFDWSFLQTGDRQRNWWRARTIGSGSVHLLLFMILVLCLFSIFWSAWQEVYQFCWSFQRTSSWLHLFFCFSALSFTEGPLWQSSGQRIAFWCRECRFDLWLGS